MSFSSFGSLKLFFIRFFFVFLSLGFLFPVETQARTYSGYCDMAESTADVLDCVKEHNDNAQNRLKDVFEQVVRLQEKEEDDALPHSQKEWVSYRNSQCAWEADQEDNPALKRVVELSCLADLTDQRSDRLMLTLNQEKNIAPREFGASPRWLNVLVRDYPDVFWDLGGRRRFDLDCDGNYEQIISGVLIKTKALSDKKKDTVELSSTPFLELVFAVVKNPATGRPEPQIFQFPLDELSVEKASFCKAKLSFAVVSASLSEKKLVQEKEQENEKACSTALQIMDGVCAPVHIFWNGTEYLIKTIESDSLNEESKKEIKG